MAENKEITWEKELIEKYMFTLHKEQVKDRRWRTMLRVLRASGFVLLMIGFIILASNPGGMPWQSAKAGAPHTAYINIRGEIAAGTLADTDHLIPSIQAAFDNPNSQAIVLRINSPGGSPVQAGRIYDEVKAQRALHPEKKVYAIIDDIGASGGYYIASAADEIYADRASLVGSIGVISSGFGFTGLMDKLGIERRAITSGEHKALLDPFSPLTSDMKKFWEGVLSKTHQQFIERVKAGRGDRLKDDPEVFSGLLWNGEQAKDIGLIDGLGSLNSVARDVIHQSNLVDYTPTEDIIRRLTQRAKLEASSFVQELSAVKVY
ncbi:Periplasmic serine protease [Vibrio mimicus VM603]|uniref:Periplasmic serine protease n=1 Tax=Vibrio mimicus VM603 TaxID=671074 RepID=D2YA70_VIBMI|nr:S49 family peptidase [Vibrio mimicus]EEW08396.1 Periplasmic serine protease [Vibrio mimicus VM603]